MAHKLQILQSRGRRLHLVQYKVLLPVAEQGAAAYKVSFMRVRGWVEGKEGEAGSEEGVGVGGWMVLRYWIKPWCLW